MIGRCQNLLQCTQSSTVFIAKVKHLAALQINAGNTCVNVQESVTGAG